MPKYIFEAFTQNGELIKGEKEAKDIFDLQQDLKKSGLILIEARPKKEVKFSFSIKKGISVSEKLFFTKNLAVMLSAGISLPEALLNLSLQIKNKNFAKAILDIQQRVLKGEKFSVALSQYPHYFSELYQNIVIEGEESGRLEENLNLLATQLEKEAELKQRVKGALIYPAVIILAMVGIGILMFVVVIPKMFKVFKELNVELPKTTKFVLTLGDFFSNNWYLVFSFLFFILIFIFQFSKTKFGKRIFDKILISLPIIGELSKKQNCAMLARSLSSLLESGISLPRALEISEKIVGNVYFKKILKEGLEYVKKGKRLSEVFKKYPRIIFPTFTMMLETGEMSGETSTLLKKIADFYENEVGEMTKSLTSIIEPVLLLLIGGVVAFFAISMLQPIYSMMQSLSQ
jgi:type IV pilus assembly protein PilC